MRTSFRSTAVLLIGFLIVILQLFNCKEKKPPNNVLDPNGTNPHVFAVVATMTTDGVVVTWQAVDKGGLTGYSIYRSDSATTGYTKLGTVGQNVTRFVDSDIWNNQVYFYRVAAVGGPDESFESQPDTALVSGARLEASPGTWSASGNGDSLWLHISNGSNVSKFYWTDSVDVSWLHNSRTSGRTPDSLKISADSNATGSLRTGRLRIFAAGASGSPDTIAVTQLSQALPQICIPPDTWDAPADGGSSGQVHVTNCTPGSTQSLRYVVSTDSSWLEITPSGGTTPGSFTITAQWNVTGQVRTASVSVIADGVVAPATILVTQPNMVWSALGSGSDGSVYALALYNNKLFAGGGFTTAGSASANNIAAWDGNSWSALGSGMNREVEALTVYSNKLIAGGWFTTAGGLSASRIAAWDGISWSALGSGIWGPPDPVLVMTLAVYKYMLIAGGRFTGAGEVGRNNIAAWDGSSWSSLGSGMDGNVYAFAVYNNRLIAGGWWATAGGTSAKSIAAWDGLSWSALGSGIDWTFTVRALTVYDNKLIAGGDFTAAGGTSANCIAAWDGSTWSALGSGMNGGVEALTVYNNKLIAGGSFTTAGGLTANHIAAWDGSSWSALGSGIDSTAFALTVYNNKLIAGGNFTVAGGTSANHIVQFSAP
jgi:hypothetical protein